MKNTEHTTIWKCHTGNLGSIKIHLLNASATGEVNGLLVPSSKSRAVSYIKLLEELVLSKIQSLQVSVFVVLGRVTKNELLQFGGIDKLGITNHKGR